MTAPGGLRTSAWRRARPLLVRLAVLALGALVSGGLAALVVIPRLVHGAALSVRSGSMAPALHVGDLVVDRHVDPATLRVGDIATYRQESGALITHRVVGIDAAGGERSFTFRGDANRAADPRPVPAGAIAGRVWLTLPRLGTVRERLARVRPAVVIAGVVALSAYALSQFGAVARDRRRRL